MIPVEESKPPWFCRIKIKNILLGYIFISFMVTIALISGDLYYRVLEPMTLLNYCLIGMLWPYTFLVLVIIGIIHIIDPRPVL